MRDVTHSMGLSLSGKAGAQPKEGWYKVCRSQPVDFAACWPHALISFTRGELRRSSGGPSYSPSHSNDRGISASNVMVACPHQLWVHNVYLPHQCLLGGQLKNGCHLAKLVIEGLQGDGWAGAGTHACRGLLQQGCGAGQHDEGLLQGSSGSCRAQGSRCIVEQRTGASCSRKALPDSMAEHSARARWGLQSTEHRAATAVHLEEQVENCRKICTCCSSEAMR